jgi:type VI secretion system secreted protein VgrG
MGTYSQQTSPAAVSSPLGEDVLLLRRMVGQEHLSELFEFNLDLFSENAGIQPEDLLGLDLTVRVENCYGTTRYFNGVVASFAYQGLGRDGRLSSYRATLRPWLWLLTRTSNCRIFQNLAAPDIILKIFSDHGLTDFQNDLVATYPTREYCVQYRETDFGFVSRMMETEGIYYYFEHKNGKHVLHLCDDMSAHAPVDHYATIVYSPRDSALLTNNLSGGGELEPILSWSVGQELQSGRYVLDDFDFKQPTASLEKNHSVSRSHAVATLEMYDYPGGYVVAGDGTKYSTVRIQELQAEYERCSGRALARGMGSGTLFTLSKFPRADQDREYLVVSVTHTVRVHIHDGLLEDDDMQEAMGGRPGKTPEKVLRPVYENTFTAMASSETFRPRRRTPKPVVKGPQTAIVTGPSGAEIHTDQYGRVKVQFHWDRYAKGDDTTSCWIRVAQLWAGKQWGAMYLPRVGQEVVVDFLEGDPDRPIVNGRLYNGGNLPPYALPDDKNKSTIKSCTVDGSGFNEIRFDDTKGSEQIFLHSQFNHDIYIKNDTKEWIGNDRHLKVVHDRLEEVGNDHHLKVKGDEKKEIDKNQHLKVGQSRFVKIGTAHHLDVGADYNQKIGGTLSINATSNIQEKAGQNYALDSGMEIHLKAGMKVIIEAGTQISLKVGGNFINITPAGVQISGTMVQIAGSATTTISGGASTAISGGGMLKLDGAMVSINGGGGGGGGGSAGSGSGSNPTAPTAPEAPTAPTDAEVGTAGQKSAAVAAKTAPTPVTITLNPSIVSPYQEVLAANLNAAAGPGAPFCANS